MPDVSIIGLGRMGTALAGTFIDDGHSTCVWNRTPAKAESLAERGAVVASTALDAVYASPVTVACVTDYEDLVGLLEPAPAGAFNAHTIINTASGTPSEAQAMRHLVRARGGSYLESHIPVYPRYIGQAETIIMYSGPAELWEQNKALLLCLGPDSLYLGEEIEACNYMAAGVATFFHVALVGFLESFAYGLASKRSLDVMLVLIEQRRMLLKDMIERSVVAISNGKFEADEATVAIHLDAMESLRKTLGEAGRRSVLLENVIRYLQDACDAGFGTEDISALVKVMGPW